MNKIELHGKFTKEELLEKMKEFDKPLFKIDDNGFYMLNKYGQYDCTFGSGLKRVNLLERIKWIFEDILKRAGFKLPTFEDIMDEDKEMYNIELEADFEKESLSFNAFYSSTFVTSKWWGEEENDYIRKVVLKDKVFIEWIESKFKGFKYV